MEERAHCDYILLAQTEKNLLLKEMNNIRCEQMQLEGKLQQLKIIEKGLREAQTNGDGGDSYGIKLLKKEMFFRKKTLLLKVHN